MIGIGIGELLFLLLLAFLIVLALLFFVYRIRKEVIPINKKIIEYIEDQKRREYMKAG